MESATILTPFSTGLSDTCTSEPNIPKDQNMKKYQHYIAARGEVLPNPHKNNDRCCDLCMQYLYGSH